MLRTAANSAMFPSKTSKKNSQSICVDLMAWQTARKNEAIVATRKNNSEKVTANFMKNPFTL
jgi:hypothetical protein